MNTPGTVTHIMVERKVGDLWVDPNVQRNLRKARVTAIAADFKPEALGVLTTSYRAADRIHVIDGQHRYRAAEAAAYTGVIHTMEYRGLSLSDEAALFRVLNTTEKVSRVDQFRVSCVEGNPDSLRLAKFIAEQGWQVGVSATPSTIGAIASLERVYKLSPEAAEATLVVLTAAYGHSPATVQGTLIEGVGRMIARYGIGSPGGIDLNDLKDRLSRVPGGPNGIVGNARGQALTRTGNLSANVAKIVTHLYNQRRRSTALPEWQ